MPGITLTLEELQEAAARYVAAEMAVEVQPETLDFVLGTDGEKVVGARFEASRSLRAPEDIIPATPASPPSAARRRRRAKTNPR